MYLKNNVWFFKNALDKAWCDKIIKKYKQRLLKKVKLVVMVQKYQLKKTKNVGILI